MGDADIDCILAIGDLIAVASSSAPTIHIIRQLKTKLDFSVEVVC
jgi:hypothetical protein